MDELDGEKQQQEKDYYDRLIRFITTDRDFSLMKFEAPKLLRHIKEYGDIIQSQIDVSKWQFPRNQHSCDELATVKQVLDVKEQIWDKFAQYRN